MELQKNLRHWTSGLNGERQKISRFVFDQRVFRLWSPQSLESCWSGFWLYLPQSLAEQWCLSGCCSQCLTEDVGQSVYFGGSLRIRFSASVCWPLTERKEGGERGRESVRLDVKLLKFIVAYIYISVKLDSWTVVQSRGRPIIGLADYRGRYSQGCKFIRYEKGDKDPSPPTPRNVSFKMRNNRGF